MAIAIAMAIVIAVPSKLFEETPHQGMIEAHQPRPQEIPNLLSMIASGLSPDVFGNDCHKRSSIPWTIGGEPLGRVEMGQSRGLATQGLGCPRQAPQAADDHHH